MASLNLISPFPEYALPTAFAWVQPALAQLADDFALRSTDALVKHAAQIDAAGGKTWGVLRDGRLCGWMSFEPVNEVSGVGHCFFAPWALGRKTTDTAVKLCLEEIFALGYERVSCPVLAANWRIRALLKRVGIAEEGVLKSFTKCGGRLADLVMAGITKEDFDGGTYGIGVAPGRPVEHTIGADRDAVEQFGDGQHGVEHTGVLQHAAGASVLDGGGAAEGNDGRDRHDADGDGGHRPDQPDVQGHRGPAPAKPGVKRVRKQRRKRNSGPAN